MFFRATTSANGTELYRSDGTITNGTTVNIALLDLVSGNGSSSPSNLTNLNGKLFFTATNSANDTELWAMDATAAVPTSPLKDINVNGSSFPFQFAATADKVFFMANDGIRGIELWGTDGTSNGTILVKDLTPTANNPSQISQMTAVGTDLYFVFDNYPNGYDLYKATSNDAVLMKGGFFSSPSSLVNLSGTLYFSGLSVGVGIELWKSNGTASGTVLSVDPTPSGQTDPGNLTNLNGTLIFTGIQSQGRSLIKSKGSSFEIVYPTSGTRSVGSQAKSYAIVDGNLVFLADNAQTAVSNPRYAASGTTRLFGADLSVVNRSNPVKLGSKAYFSATDASHGSELWVTDGTVAGTMMVKDLNPGFSSSYINEMRESGGLLYFMASTPDAIGWQMWRSDGTSQGTLRLTNVAYPSGIIGQSIVGERLATVASGNSFKTFFAFTGNVSANGVPLWVTDGTFAGTKIVIDPLGNSPQRSEELTEMNEYVYFRTGLIGSPQDKVQDKETGIAYVYDINTGAILQTFSRPSIGEYLGQTVSVSGAVGIVGAAQNGLAYLFNTVTGQRITTIENPTPAANEQFGKSVAVSGNLVVVGAPNDDTSFNNSGRAFFFNATTGMLSRIRPRLRCRQPAGPARPFLLRKWIATDAYWSTAKSSSVKGALRLSVFNWLECQRAA